MRDILTLLAIAGYLIISLIIGINQYINIGELPKSYIITQWVVLIISVIITFSFQNPYSQTAAVLSTLGGGIAMMVIIQAVLFFIFGRFITAGLSTGKIILLIILGLVVVKLIHWLLTRNLTGFE